MARTGSCPKNQFGFFQMIRSGGYNGVSNLLLSGAMCGTSIPKTINRKRFVQSAKPNLHP